MVEKGNNALTNIISVLKAIIVCIIICGGLLFLILAVGWYLHGVEGRVSVVSDEFELSDDVVCTCGYQGIELENVLLLREKGRYGIKVRHNGEGYKYRYKFTLVGDDILVHPVIYYERSNTNSRDEWKIVFYIKKVEGRWEVTANSFGNDGKTVVSSVVFTDMERDGIELKYMEEGHWLYRLSSNQQE